MVRILIFVVGFVVGGVIGFFLAAGAFELMNPATVPPAAETPDEARGRIIARQSARFDWAIPGGAIGGFLGLGLAFLLQKPEPETPRPPADFKVGDPPPHP